MNKRYANFEEMVDVLLESPEEKLAFRQESARRRTVTVLTALRASKDVSQCEVANVKGCGQARISKLENGYDEDVTLADLEAYAKATKTEITLLISPRRMSLAEQVKYHAQGIRQAFLKLSELAQTDETIAKGVAELHVQAFHNINKFLAESAEKLPPSPDNGMPHVHIAASSDPQASASSPLPKRKKRKTVPKGQVALKK